MLSKVSQSHPPASTTYVPSLFGKNIWKPIFCSHSSALDLLPLCDPLELSLAILQKHCNIFFYLDRLLADGVVWGHFLGNVFLIYIILFTIFIWSLKFICFFYWKSP